MGRRGSRLDSHRDEIVRRYEEGESLASIGESFEMTGRGVGAWLRKQGIEGRSGWSPDNYRALIGNRYGARRIVGVVAEKSSPTLLLQCDHCNSRAEIRALKLRAQETVPCRGCMKHPSLKHGHTQGGESPEYRAWRAMLQRCNDPNGNRYEFYKEISICDQWTGPSGFETFLADMGSRPSPQHSVDREDNAGDYTPENTRWATSKQQARNRRSTEMLTIKGETKPLAEWAEIAGVKYWTFYRRIKVYGMDPEEALEKASPERTYKKHKLMVNGVTKTPAEWARETGINYTTIRARLKRGWSPEDAVTRPMKRR